MSAIGQIEAHRTALNERAGVLAKAQHRPAGIGAEILRGIPGGDGCEPNHSAKETAAITQTGSADRRTAGAQGHADAEQIQAQGIGRGGVEMSHIEHLAEGVTLYLGDCREILPTLGKVDAVVTLSLIHI